MTRPITKRLDTNMTVAATMAARCQPLHNMAALVEIINMTVAVAVAVMEGTINTLMPQ